MHTQGFFSRGHLRSQACAIVQPRPSQLGRPSCVVAVTAVRHDGSSQRRRSRRSILRSAAPIAEAPVKQQGFPRGDEWALHKFGGTCVSAAERISEAGDVLVQVSTADMHSMLGLDRSHISASMCAVALSGRAISILRRSVEYPRN